MALLSYNSLVCLVDEGIINADYENINGASIDITLDKEILIERPMSYFRLVDLKEKQSLEFSKYQIKEEGYKIYPGTFLLASSRETFNLPPTIAAEYKLKSSLARSGLQHLLAGWCDPGWTDSKLTLELKNITSKHTLVLREGMKIGQMVFWECEPVPEQHSYANRGQYNRQQGVTSSKGLR